MWKVGIDSVSLAIWKAPGSLEISVAAMLVSLWEEFMAGARTGPTLYPEWFRRAFRVLKLPTEGSEVDEVVRQYNVVFKNSLRLYPDVDPALKRLRGWTDPLLWPSILTNGPEERQLRRIQALGLEGAIPVWCISEEMGVGKPHPEFFHAALRSLHMLPEDAVMIGDSLEADIVGAKAVRLFHIFPSSDACYNVDNQKEGGCRNAKKA